MEPQLSAGLLIKYLGSWRGQDRGGLASMYSSLLSATAEAHAIAPTVSQQATQESLSVPDAPLPLAPAWPPPHQPSQEDGLQALQKCEHQH